MKAFRLADASSSGKCYKKISLKDGGIIFSTFSTTDKENPYVDLATYPHKILVSITKPLVCIYVSIYTYSYIHIYNIYVSIQLCSYIQHICKYIYIQLYSYIQHICKYTAMFIYTAYVYVSIQLYSGCIYI